MRPPRACPRSAPGRWTAHPGRQEEGGRGPGCRPVLQGVHPRAVVIVHDEEGRTYVRAAKDLPQELLASSAKRPKLGRARIVITSARRALPDGGFRKLKQNPQRAR